MSRRTLTLLLAGVLTVALTAAAAFIRVPYVALGPGPTFNTLGTEDGRPILDISGRPTYPTDGHLDLTTVGVQSELTLAQALRGWFESDEAVVPRDVVYPPDQSQQQTDQMNVQEMKQSQDLAVTAAARTLGLPTATVLVAQVPAGSPSAGKLLVGDRILSVDATMLRDRTDLQRLVQATRPGTTVELRVVRDGAERTVPVTTTSAGDGKAARTVIGVSIAEKPIDAPFQVKIGLRDVGGPSAGLMFTLGILDKLGEGSLTGGRYIAGTGEIRADGTVGPIGGITQKLIAAKRKGAVAFLVPADNCTEALARHPDGLPLLEVTDVKDALDGLQALRRGQQPRLCATG